MSARKSRSILILATAAALGAVTADAFARDRIAIVGSSTVYPFSSAVAEIFGRGGQFKAPTVESIGTGGGFKVFCGGLGVETPDINDASRPMTDSERAACAEKGVTAVEELRIGYDGIIVAAQAKQPTFDVTLEQLWRATAKTVPVNGKLVPNPYRKWSDIDPRLPAKEIAIYGPAPNHGTRDAWVELVMDPSCEMAPEVKGLDKDSRKKVCQTVREDGAWTDVSEDYGLIMGKLSHDPEAMAVFTFSYLDQNRDKIAAVTVGGTPASLETIAAGKYPISRPLFIYVKRQHVGVIPGIQEFVNEYLSDKAAGPEGYLADRGLIPMPKAELEAQRVKAAQLR
jgi:phosphate transport system substrate-binding protein